MTVSFLKKLFKGEFSTYVDLHWGASSKGLGYISGQLCPLGLVIEELNLFKEVLLLFWWFYEKPQKLWSHFSRDDCKLSHPFYKFTGKIGPRLSIGILKSPATPNTKKFFFDFFDFLKSFFSVTWEERWLARIPYDSQTKDLWFPHIWGIEAFMGAEKNEKLQPLERFPRKFSWKNQRWAHWAVRLG